MKTLLHGLLLLLCAQVIAQTSGPVIYFSDRQAGAQPDAVIGSNSNPGTLEAPKQNLSGVNINTLPAGTRLLFARGGAWTHGNLRIANPNARADAPIAFDAYGSGPAPIITTTSGSASFEFGLNFFDPTTHGGYVFRNLTLRGPGGTTESWGFWLKGNVSHVTVENVDLSGYYIAINCQAGGTTQYVTIRNNHIHDNRGMGILGYMNDGLIEGNLFTTPTTTGFVHQIYLSNGNRNTVRGNRLIYDRLCTGGHITAHGRIDRLTVEDNFIQCPDATEGSWGISLSPYHEDTVQGFTNLIVRRNYLENVGNTAIAITAAPGVVVEDNITRLTVDRYQSSVMIGNPELPSHLRGPGTVRNNIHYGYSGGFYGPAGSTITGNTHRSGAPVAPATPSGVTATGSDRQIRLDWPQVPDASRYIVQRATARSGPYTTIDSRLTSPTLTDTGRVNDTTYYYVVSAANAFASSPESTPISATPRLSPPPEVSVASSAASIREEAAETARFVITRRDTNANTLVVNFTLSGTAQSGTDFTTWLSTSRATIPAGSDSVTVTLTAVPDALSEGDEAILLTLTADPLYALGTTSFAQTILEDRPLDGWRFSRFSSAQLANAGISGNVADPDGDGRTNLLEYALGTDPLRVDNPAPLVEADAGHLVMEYPRRPVTDGVAYTPEVSSDLMNWVSGPAHVSDVSLRDLGEGSSLRRATDLAPLNEGNRRFLRLRVTAP